MVQKTAYIDGIGEITLAKRRGSKTIRLSVTSAGKIRVGLPLWLPYAAGVEFATNRKDWIARQMLNHQDHKLTDGGRIGKSYRLAYEHVEDLIRPSTRIIDNTIRLRAALPLEHESVQAAARRAAEKALKREAAELLPKRLRYFADKYKFEFKSVKIKRLTSRWGSCTSHKEITLNYFLMQLPWALIDHVLLHELVHTEYMNHSPDFWRRFEAVLPEAKNQRTALKNYRPVINSVL